VVVSNPRQTRIIAEAKIKTDRIDAAVLIQLYGSGFRPELLRVGPRRPIQTRP
jgi:transposase